MKGAGVLHRGIRVAGEGGEHHHVLHGELAARRRGIGQVGDGLGGAGGADSTKAKLGILMLRGNGCCPCGEECDKRDKESHGEQGNGFG